jgi:hypothetical protein
MKDASLLSRYPFSPLYQGIAILSTGNKFLPKNSLKETTSSRVISDAPPCRYEREEDGSREGFGYGEEKARKRMFPAAQAS